MKTTYCQRLTAITLLASTLWSSCSQPSHQGAVASQSEIEHARQQRSAHGQKKWDELAAALKIPNNRLDLTEDEIAAINAQHASIRARVKAKEELLARKYRQVLGQVSAYLSEPSELGNYKDLVLKIANKFADHAYATRCAAIVSFKPSALIKPSKEVDIFELSYKLQGNRQGQAEEIVRTGLLSIPKAPGPFPLLGFAHADDQGLAYRSLERNLSALQEHHIVVAPTFPGEPLCAQDTGERDANDGAPNLSCATTAELLAKPVGESKPWDNDADELLGMYDCVAKVAAGHYLGAASEAAGGGDDPLLAPYWLNQADDGGDLVATQSLSQALASKVRFVDQTISEMTFKGFPMGSLAGASRGGLVTSVALAKAGAAWNRLLLEAGKRDAQLARANAALGSSERRSAKKPVFLSTLLGFLMNATTLSRMSADLGEDERAEWQHMFDFLAEQLGARYGLLPPPAFNGVLTLAAPTSIIAGRLRLQLEQMVKGNGDVTPGQHLPGLRKLGSIFDRYRAGEESVDDAVHEVIARDATFLAPLMFASLKRWNKAAQVTRNAKNSELRGLRERGSILMLHHENDRVVPFDQMQTAANIFISQAHHSFMRSITMSPGGVELTIRPLSNQAATKLSGRRSFDHIDHSFFEESYVRVSPDFIVPVVLKQAFAKDWFFDHKEESDAQLVNAAIRHGINQGMSHAAQLLWPTDDKAELLASVSSQSLRDIFARLGAGEVLTTNDRQTLSVLRMQAVNGTLTNATLQEDADGNLTCNQKPMDVIAAWQASLY